VSDDSLSQKIIEKAGLSKVSDKVFNAFQNKNPMLLNDIFIDNDTDPKYKDILTQLLSLHLPLDKGIEQLEKILDDETFRKNIEYLKGLALYLRNRDLKTEVFLDFSVPKGLKYYDRLSFVGIIPGVSSEILRGGEYSNLVKTKEKSYLASGFAIYLEKIEEKGSL
jgi:ATP phosphoribosyltransferase regulatory subunit HisZ